MKKVNRNIVIDSFKVSGMTCASCAGSIETYLNATIGINEVLANYPNNSVRIEYDNQIISLEVIQEKIKEIGYELVLDDSNNQFNRIETERLSTLKNRMIFSFIFSTPVFILSMFFMGKLPYEHWILLILSTPVLIWSGREFFVIAWKRLLNFSANMDTLVALSTGVAFLYSLLATINPGFLTDRGVDVHVYYESAVVIISLILLGRYLEEQAKGKTSFAIQKLIGLTPIEVIVIRNGEEVEINIKEIAVGDLIVIKPGSKIPVDGKVKKGESYINESMISGEPIPVVKRKGDPVFAGTINQKGNLRILAEKVGQDTLLSQIIKLVENAQASKPNIQRLVDKIAGIFVPVVLFLALVTFIVWYSIGPEPRLTYSLVTTITVLIIACPCALGLATPTALMVGIGKGAEHGILIKDADTLETAHKTDILVLDKTGTITSGNPTVQEIHWNDKLKKDTYLEILLELERASEHPLAESIVRHLLEQNVVGTEITDFKSITGVGVSCKKDNQTYRIGKLEMMTGNHIVLSEQLDNLAENLKGLGHTVVYFSAGPMVAAIISISDSIKENAKEFVRELDSMGIEVHMLTGDNEKTAKNVADSVGISIVSANVLPSQKSNYIKRLQGNGKIVAMVGDGINDSGALAQSNIGIAMGSGTDIAMDSAGITLMNSDLTQITQAIKLSKLTIKTIRQNLFWAFIYNLIAIPIAAGALYPFSGFLLNPMIAGGAMSLSSLSVLANSLKLRKQLIK